jgi:hypothetical protein
MFDDHVRAQNDQEKDPVCLFPMSPTLFGRPYGKITMAEDSFWITVKDNPWNCRKVAGIIHGKSILSIPSAFAPIAKV